MRFSKWGPGIGLGLLALAGCQAEGEKFRISEQRVPEQVDLKVESVRQFVPEGALAAQPGNPGAKVLEDGEIAYRLWRLTNVGSVAREVFPYSKESLDRTRLKIDQFEVGACVWEGPACLRLDLDTPSPDAYLAAFPRRTVRYHSEFRASAAEFEWSSGGRETLRSRAISDPTSSGIRLPPGESVSLILHFVLAPGFDLLPSSKNRSMAPPGENYFPRTAVPSDYLGDRLFGIVDEVSGSGIDLLVRDHATSALNPLYFRVDGRRKTLFRTRSFEAIPAIGYPAVPFPPTGYARTVDGLAVQY